MKILKGTLLLVTGRKGAWKGVALKDFDTDKDEWYPLASAQEEDIVGFNTRWFKGEEVPSRRGVCTVEKIKGEEK